MNFKTLFLIILIGSTNACQKRAPIETIAFDYVKNQIVLSVHIGESEPLNMLLDTGVDPSVVDFETAKRLKLPIDTLRAGNAQGRGTDRVVVFPTTIEDLSINNYNYGSIDALTLDLKKLGAPLKKRLHGILGYSFLKDKIVRINYRDKVIQFLPDSTYLDEVITDKVYSSKFITDGEDMIPILNTFKINNNDFVASLDTGSSLNVQVYMHHKERFKIELDSTQQSLITGAQGKKKIYNTYVPNFSIGNFQFEDEAIHVSTIKNEKQLRMGNIGNRFLDNFIVTFDYHNKKVILEAYSNSL